MDQLYADIAARTGGNVYIGVVGPVRTGKSTFIKRFMEQLVLPNIPDPYRRERATDELPQSGSGKTITTSEPKFVPEEAVEISPDGTTRLRVRLIDSVGYMVEGAVGATEDGAPRMVCTPWCDREIPLTEAAELGTRKVMEEHCTLGLVVTTDGTVTDIPREDYAVAEERAIRDMQATGKPFLTVINSREPEGEAALALQDSLQQRFGCCPMVLDCQAMTKAEVAQLLQQLLYAFPMTELQVFLPRWFQALSPDSPLHSQLRTALLACAQQSASLAHTRQALAKLTELEPVQEVQLRTLDPSTGTASVELRLPDQLFYELLSHRAGAPIQDDAQLLDLLTKLSATAREYEKVSEALQSVRATGYGVVMPGAEDMTLEKPELPRKGSAYGVKLKAGAPAIHMLRVDIDTEITPMVGDEQQSRDLMEYLTGEAPEKLWESNIFGKSVYTLIQEGLTAKLVRMPEEVRSRFRGALSRIVNEGATGLVCLIL